MFEKNGGNESWAKIFIVLLCLTVFVLSTAGCETLRKKFTRQKKAEEESKTDIPVLEPIDYPAKIHTADESYRQHYSLWKVWYKDLITTIDDEGSDKRIKYLLDQNIVQLEEMAKWINEAKQNELKEIIDNFNTIKNELDRPSSMRISNSIKNRLEENAKKIRTNFNVKVIQLNLKSS